MSRVFEALLQSERERAQRASHPPAESSQVAADANLTARVATESPQVVSKPKALPGGIASVQPLIVPRARLVSLGETQSLGAEKFRVLGTRLSHLKEKRNFRKVIITSSIAEEGKSLVAANLAVTLARRPNQRVLLLDGDLHQPMQSQLFGQNGLKGLSEYLEAPSPLDQHLYRVEPLPLWLLPAGDRPEHPLELLQGEKLPALLIQLEQWFDWVIIDCPPLLPLADTNVWARHSDGILLVARQNLTPKKLLRQAIERLDHPNLLGTILNCSSDEQHNYYYSHYYSPNGRRSKRRETEAQQAT